MINLFKEGIILKKNEPEFENEGALNPVVIHEGDEIHLFYRAVRMENYSSIGYYRLEEPLTIAKRFSYPLIVPEYEYESHGEEDPSVVKIDELYYVTYTVAVGGQ